MRKEETFRILGEIDEQFLTEAETYLPGKKRGAQAKILRFVLPAAAALLLTLVAVFAVFPALRNRDPSFLAGGKEYNGLTYVIRNGKARVVEVKNDVITLPAQIEGAPVTSLTLNRVNGSGALKIRVESSDLNELKLPATCSASLTFAESVTHIDPEILRSEKIASIEVEESNAVYSSSGDLLLNKEQTTLYACLPATGSAAFGTQESENPGAYPLPETLETVADNAFKDCKGIRSVSLPQGLRAVGKAAFAGCVNLKELYLPQTLQSAPEDLLEECNALTYLRTALTEEQFSSLGVLIPENGQLFAALPQSTEEEILSLVRSYFSEAERYFSWLSSYNNIPFDAEQALGELYKVDVEDVHSIADLKEKILPYLSSSDALSQLPQIVLQVASRFKETNGQLYVLPSECDVRYDEGTREYALTKNEDGSYHLIVRTTVPLQDYSITVDCEYDLVLTEEAISFLSPFVLPVSRWYPQYLREKGEQ